MKLIHNIVCHGVFLLTSEACRLAEHFGIPLETSIAVMNAGNARSFVTEARFPNHVISGRFNGRSKVSNLAKDLRMASELAASARHPGSYAALTAGLLDAALKDGQGDTDFTTLYALLLDLERKLNSSQSA